MRYVTFCSVLVIALGLVTQPAEAAVVSFSVSPEVVHVGDEVVVTVLANTEQEVINAIESTVTFPENLLEFVSVDDSRSIVSLWVLSPHMIDAQTISFSGVAPGGFVQADAELVSLVFKAVRVGEGALTFGTSTALLRHDGAGTPAAIVRKDIPVRVVSGDAGMKAVTVDDELPEPFTPALLVDPDVFEGVPGLIFSTSDKGSGLDHYEVAEGYWGRYVRAASPYKIIHTNLDRALYVKAVDRQGNERVEVLYPHNWRPWYQSVPMNGSIFVSSAIVLCLFLFGVVRFVRTGRFSFWR